LKGELSVLERLDMMVVFNTTRYAANESWQVTPIPILPSRLDAS
jgi:hypothetical protein